MASPSIKVSKILIHPIKSCRGISVESSRYTVEGLENDRLWCIIDAKKLSVITAREVPKMVLIIPSFHGDGTLHIAFPEDSGCQSFSIPLRPSEDTLKTWSTIPQITMWAGQDPVDGYICESISGTISATLSKYFERAVHLVFKGPRPRPVKPTTTFPNLAATSKYQDMYPLLILSKESMSLIEQELGACMDTLNIAERWKDDSSSIVIERFRPNIVVSGAGPFAEDNWQQISVGPETGPAIKLVSKCTRCLLPNVDPETGKRDTAVPYKVIMKFRIGLDPKEKMKPCVGCNAVPSSDGIVRVGDAVHVL